MAIFSALTVLDGEPSARALEEALDRLEPAPVGTGVSEIEDGSGLWEVAAYFDAAPDETGLTILSAAFSARPFAVSDLPDTDWVAKVKRELAPVAAGRFFVYGGHDADRVPDGKIALLIEAAMAFGTGHHGTTLGCLRALDRLADTGFHAARVADIGAGTAVLAMAAARLWDIAVLASDIDPVATEVAAANAAVNGLGDRIGCVTAAGFSDPAIAARGPFDLVFANILMTPLVALAPDMGRHIAPGGRAILSGILNEQAETVLAAYDEAGFARESAEIIGDWTTLLLRRQ